MPWTAGPASSFLNNSSTFQTLDATAQDNIVFGPGLTVTAAAPATGSLTLTAQTGTMSDTGALTLNAVAGVTLDNNLATAPTATRRRGDLLSIDADTDNDGGDVDHRQRKPQVITKNNSNLTAIFGTLNLLGTLNSTGATTTLSPTHLQTIGVLGAGAAPVGNFQVDQALLNKITAQNLTLGGTLNSDITVDGFLQSSDGAQYSPARSRCWPRARLPASSS